MTWINFSDTRSSTENVLVEFSSSISVHIVASFTLIIWTEQKNRTDRKPDPRFWIFDDIASSVRIAESRTGPFRGFRRFSQPFLKNPNAK
jgi:hypothetical protein